MMFTSADDIQKSINKIKNLSSVFEMQEILLGNYKIEDNFIIIIITKPQLKKKLKRKPALPEEKAMLSFFINLQIESTRKKNFTKLMWIQYSVMLKYQF